MVPVSIGMVAITAAYLGCSYEIIDTRTAWAHSIVDEAMPEWRVSSRLKIR